MWSWTKETVDEDIFIAKAGNPQIGYLKQIAFEDPPLRLSRKLRKVFAPMERRKKNWKLRHRHLRLIIPKRP